MFELRKGSAKGGLDIARTDCVCMNDSNLWRAKSRILVSENTLSLQECTFLIALYDRYSELTCSEGKPRPLHYYTLRDVDSESASWVYGVTLRCKEKIKVYLSTQELFVESLFVACLLSGDSHIAHADNERREQGRWVPNHTPTEITPHSLI
jgi:hypothetical protein